MRLSAITEDNSSVNLQLISADVSIIVMFSCLCKKKIVLMDMRILANLQACTREGLQSKTFQIWGSSQEKQTN